MVSEIRDADSEESHTKKHLFRTSTGLLTPEIEDEDTSFADVHEETHPVELIYNEIRKATNERTETLEKQLSKAYANYDRMKKLHKTRRETQNLRGN